jgi:hypothetical protein
MTNKSKPKSKPKPAGRRDVKLDHLEAILERARTAPLGEADFQTLRSAVDTLAFVTRELEMKGASIRRLRRLLFGASTEKTSKVLGEKTAANETGDEPSDRSNEADASTDQGKRPEPKPEPESEPKPKPKGHGRNAASAYRGAEKIAVSHDSLERGDRCPDCGRGKLHRMATPKVLVRVTGMAPLRAEVYEIERLRCGLCGTIYAAQPPPGVGNEKYDETAASMIALLKYGCGVPFNRLEKLQHNLGIPLPATTQWEVVDAAADLIAPAHEELIRQAAQGEVLHNDDTRMKILEVAAPSDDEGPERTGTYTSGIVATGEGHDIVLFFTGRRHAGENLEDVLAQRASELPRPIQMCDGLSHNTAGDFDALLARCTAHARRKFVEVAESFPDECAFVLQTLREVYRHDNEARELELSPGDRLALHQARSKPLIDELERWLAEQTEERKVEPNSSLGNSIAYMRKHWAGLTLFLREPGAPLDNNICERALKKAILHRKNAMFYKTQKGARVGDLFMSLIHTAELCGADPFDYLVALQRHHQRMAETPGDWMPWNFEATLQTFCVDAPPE